MSATTTADVQRQLAEEAATHAAAMATIQDATNTVQTRLTEAQQSFTELVTRVTELRIRKGEALSTQTSDQISLSHCDTGSDRVDALLEALRTKLSTKEAARTNTTNTNTGSVLQRLETAALEAMTPFTERRVSALFTSNAAAVRTTSVMLLFQNDVRGVRAWAKKHFSSCASCSARLAQLPAWTPSSYASKRVGLACAPNLRAIPHKRYHKLSVSLLQERSLAGRVDTEEHLELLRGTFFVHVQSKAASGVLADAAASCAAMTEALQTFASESLTTLREAARAAAPWNVGPDSNSDVSAAMEILLHLLEVRVMVQPVPQPAVTHQGAPCSLVQLSCALVVPLQVSAIAPLLSLLQVKEHRTYFAERVLTPLVLRWAAALSLGDCAAHYTAVGCKAAEALYEIAKDAGIVSSAGASLAQLYYVLQAFAVFGTTVEVEVATPHVLPDGATTATLQEGKAAALRLLRSVLERFCPSEPLATPPVCDPTLSELTVKVTRAPTGFLEILNQSFSSDQRMPATSRSSALDTFVSPKSKISLGLRLFRELVIDVYRPYHPCTGVVLASENGAGSRPRAAACVPVIDLPVDIATANVRVATAMTRCVEALRRCESAAAAVQRDDAAAAGDALSLETAGNVVVTAVKEQLQQAEALTRLRAKWSAAAVAVVGVPKACVDVVVPFSMAEADVRRATKPLLYLRVIYEC